MDQAAFVMPQENRIIASRNTVPLSRRVVESLRLPAASFDPGRGLILQTIRLWLHVAIIEACRLAFAS